MINFLLIIFAFLIPLENRISVWLNFGGGFNLTNVFTILLVLGWIFKRRGNARLIVKNPLNLPISMLIIFTYFSFVTGSSKLGIPFFGDEFRTYKSFLATFILFFVVANTIIDKKQIKKILSVMTVMVLLTALVAIKEFREADVWHYSDSARAYIFGLQPNMLGALFAQYIPLFAGFFYLSKNRKYKNAYLLFFTICLLGIMFTYSRGAYLATAGALLVMAILGGKKPFLGTTLLLSFAILSSSVLFGHGRLLPVSVRERIDSVKEEDKSIDLRKEVWELARGYIGESPVFGYGYGASDRLLYLENRGFQLDTHNMYLDIALECGIPALLIFLWFILSAFKTAFRAFKATQDDFYKAISLGAMGSLVALAIGNYFGTRLILLAANGYFAILMGMTARIYYLNVGKKSSLFND